MVAYPMVPEFILAHAMLVFTFKPGGLVNSSGQESQALTLTIEAALPPGQMYDLIKCAKKTFNIVWNLTTFENYAKQQIVFNPYTTKSHRLIIYPVRLDEGQKKQLLKEAIIQAGKNRGGEYYHITRNNCTQNLVVLLNHVLPLPKQIKQWWIPNCLYNMNATVPVNVFKSLIKKEILGDVIFEISTEKFTSKIPRPSSRQ